MYLNSSAVPEPSVAQHRASMGGASVSQHRSPYDGGAADRPVIRIRNIRESAVYHLTFEGDVGRLTGAQLKTHITGVCGIPHDQQILTYNGQPIHDHNTGYDINLRTGSMIILDLVNRPAGSVSMADSQSRSIVPSTPAVASHPQVSEGLISREGTRENRSQGTYRTQDKNCVSDSTASHSMRFEREVADVRRTEDETLRKQDILTRIHQERNSTYPTYGASGINDDVDMVVEVEEESCDWQLTNSADIEDHHLMQQDYVWQMEQVRFETERMHREKEMKRQHQELEYQAEVLERERIELERKSRGEKVKLAAMQNTMHDEMLIHARFTTDAHNLLQ